jgi:glycosyltransferase involved in cell wall biosynthesis
MNTPRVSVGMPAYNASAHIAHAIASITAQTFADFEIIVSDNASTDATRDIVEQLAAKDSRIRYVRQRTNMGANRNYTFVAAEARGEYFKWASSSDWCAPTFLQRCVTILDSNADTVLAAPRTRLFQGDLSNARDYEYDIAVEDESPVRRVIQLSSTMKLNNAMNRLIRTAVLRRTRLIEPYYGADTVLMVHLAMLGKIRLHDEPLYYRRMETDSSTALQDAESVRKHHYPTSGLPVLFQNTKHNIGWIRAAFSAPLPLRERGRLLAYLVRRSYWNSGALLDDLNDAARYLRSHTDF